MIENAIRSLFWAIAKLFLSIGDWIYDILETVLNLDLSNSKVIFYTWLFMMIFLSFACFFRIAFVLLQKSADDNEKIDISKLLRKIGGCFLVAALSTTFFNFCLTAPGYIVRTYNRVITYDERMTSSTAVISATAKTPVTTSIDDMSSTDEVIGIETIDEKLNEKEGGEYIYFLGYAELLLCVIGAIIVAILQINLIIDATLRLFLNIFRFVIGFIPISSLVEDNPTCGDWVKDMISDAFMMMFVPVSLNMLYGFMSTSAFTLLNGIVRIIVFAIGLMAISKSGDMIARYIGASNLSKGKGVGGAILGMMAIRGAGNVIRGAAKYIPKGTKAVGSVAKGGIDKMTQVAKDTKTTALKQAAMTGSIADGVGNPNSKNNKKDAYFVNNNSNETFQSSSSKQSINESILDQSPTSNVMHSTGEKTFDNVKNTMVSSNKNATNYSGSDAVNNMSSNNVNSGEKRDTRDTSDVAENKSSLHNSSLRYPLNFTGNAGFIDDSTSGHLYKSSDSIYKQKAGDRIKNQINETKVKTSNSGKTSEFYNFEKKNYSINSLEKGLINNE